VSVRVHPGARRSEVGGRYGTDDPPVLIVRVAAPAVDGRANSALLEALAAAFGIRRRALTLVSGTTSRNKVVDVEGGDPARLDYLLRGPRGL
jgi:uncharacterized protein (TIGR00251 family)